MAEDESSATFAQSSVSRSGAEPPTTAGGDARAPSLESPVMTFDDLIAWVDEAVDSLDGRGGIPKPRRRHLARMHQILVNAGDEPAYAAEWISFARTLAKDLDLPPPQVDGPHELVTRAPRPRVEVPAHPKKRRKAKERERPKRRLARRAGAGPIEMNPQLERAFALVEQRKPIVFVTGGAGTGKSTFIRALRERFANRPSVVLAPTGVAALNAGGQTIHSFCQLPLGLIDPDQIDPIDEPDLVRAIDLLVIDEISMVRADVLDGVDRFLRVNRASKERFGGVQVVFVGDLFQLPPVLPASMERPFLQRFDSPWFFSARCLQGGRFAPVELEIVYRQQDRAFAELLAAIREGEGAALHHAVDAINRAAVGRTLEGEFLTLVPTRAAAAAENELRLDQLKGKSHTYEGRAEGNFKTGDEDRMPAPSTLALKRGAQVMFVRNDPERRWVNGTLGIVERLGKSSIHVRLEDDALYEVEPVEWENVRYSWDAKAKQIVEEVAGTFTQFPLMPAWAVTIHKAQGLTLDQVAIDLGRGAFAEGQVYVALSRAASLEGLSLTRAVRVSEVRASGAARGFYGRMRGR